MKSILTLLTLFVVFAAQSQILKKTYHDYQKTKPDEVYYVNAQGQNNGSYTKYNYNGAKAVEATFLNGTLNGPGKEYYTKDGASKLKITGSYKNGEKHGQWITYTYVKYGQSYFNIIQSMMFNDKEVDIFNTGVQTKVNEEVYDNGKLTKEIIYHLTGKIATSRNFINKMCTGEYLAYNSKNNLTIKGTIGEKGKMIGEWTIPRKEDGTSPDKNNTEECTYTQKIKFDNAGNIDTNYVSKSYYLSGKLRDSVHVISLEFPSGYNYSGFWFLCGKNKLVKGSYRSFHETGKTKSEGQYNIENAQSIKTGIWKNYDANGVLINEVNEDETREKATESKKEAERVEKERVEKERIEMEEKLNYENKNKTEIKLLADKADSCIQLERKLYHEYSILYKNTSSFSLDKHFVKIHNYFENKIEQLQNQTKEVKGDELENKKQLYTQIIELGIVHSNVNRKMIKYESLKVTFWEEQQYNLGRGELYKLKVSLNDASEVADKIKIIENYQFEPK
jgi:antitoxin component YwqK of YwqJK toxin-antitoxin module